MTGERDKLLLEVEPLEQENEEKLKTLETIKIENMVLNPVQHRRGPYGPPNDIYSFLAPLWSTLSAYTF